MPHLFFRDTEGGTLGLPLFLSPSLWDERANGKGVLAEARALARRRPRTSLDVSLPMLGSLCSPVFSSDDASLCMRTAAQSTIDVSKRQRRARRELSAALFRWGATTEDEEEINADKEAEGANKSLRFR